MSASANRQRTWFSRMLRTGIPAVCASNGVILRFGLQTPLCNLCREVYNETKAEGFLAVFAVALLAEGVDRNFVDIHFLLLFPVALLAEGVDRNRLIRKNCLIEIKVALLAEGVDRNCI